MILAIRSRRVAITALFIAAAVLAVFVYLKVQAEVLLENLQYFVEDNIGKALGATVSMNSIKIGVVGPTVLNGFNLTKDTSQDTPFIFKSDRIIIYYNISRIVVKKLLKKGSNVGEDFVFKIENGFLYKGTAPILKNISGSGKILNDHLIFDDISGKCYNIPLSVHGKVSRDTSMLDLDVRSASGRFKGKFHLSSHILNPHIVGTVELDERRRLYFSGDLDIKPGESVSFDNFIFGDVVLASGKLDFSKKRFCAELKKLSAENADTPASKDIVQMVGDFSNDAILQASIFFNHIGIGRFDFQSQMDVELAFVSSRLINGKINTSGTILDYRPVKELSGEFSIEDRVFKVAYLKWGEAYELAGFVNLYPPHEADVALDIKESNLSQLLLVSDLESEGRVSGKISGRIKTQGPINDLTTVAKLECGRGNIGNLDYESMNINLRGAGPVLKVADSRILRKEGYIDLSGDVDLRRLWSQDPCKGLDWACGNEAIVWDGWDIVKPADSRELQMKKAVGREKEFMITFKSYLNDEQSWQDSQGQRQNEAVGVEYNLDEAKKVKMQIKNNEEVFSLENKVKF